MPEGEIPSTRRSLDEIVELRGDRRSYLTDMVFSLLERGEELPENTCSSGNDYIEEDEDEENPCDVEADREFWEEQYQFIQVRLRFHFAIFFL